MERDKNVLHLEKGDTLGRKGRYWKNGSHLKKGVTFWKTVTPRKMGKTWKK